MCLWQINADIYLLTLKKRGRKGEEKEAGGKKYLRANTQSKAKPILETPDLGGEKPFILVGIMNYSYKIKLRHTEKKALPKINN